MGQVGWRPLRGAEMPFWELCSVFRMRDEDGSYSVEAFSLQMEGMLQLVLRYLSGMATDKSVSQLKRSKKCWMKTWHQISSKRMDMGPRWANDEGNVQRLLQKGAFSEADQVGTGAGPSVPERRERLGKELPKCPKGLSLNAKPEQTPGM